MARVTSETFKRDGRVYAELREYLDGPVLVQEWVDVHEDGTRLGRVNFRVADGFPKSDINANQVIECWWASRNSPTAQALWDLDDARAFMTKTAGWGVLHVQWPPHQPA